MNGLLLLLLLLLLTIICLFAATKVWKPLQSRSSSSSGALARRWHGR
jgi:hypothetical protein